MVVKHFATVVKDKQTKLFAVDSDGLVYRWDYVSGAWVLYKKTD